MKGWRDCDIDLPLVVSFSGVKIGSKQLVERNIRGSWQLIFSETCMVVIPCCLYHNGTGLTEWTNMQGTLPPPPFPHAFGSIWLFRESESDQKQHSRIWDLTECQVCATWKDLFESKKKKCEMRSSSIQETPLCFSSCSSSLPGCIL